ncbi:ABC transporter substrate-binding protein [Campylobacter hyointestinalis]|uniref:ABC transporter substrate-binding protein n=1 Tax=Campylobacter hyointestinalis TaxID=198 RepID=UPI000724D87A|nr:ABC transporter substrate-binding protein [Campylobacter hyointestinalis]CUU68371.1 twin-arginine translocation pathway signal [Campylobacter hyointestinalis subsp. hyointestinalis]
MTRRYALGFLASFLAFHTSKTLASELKIPIKVGFLPITDHLIIVAKELYKHPNYEIIPVKFSNWADLSEALRSKAVDAAFLLAPLGLMLRASGIKIKAVLAAHKNGSALVARNDISNLQDLKGKNIGIPSRFSTHYFLLDKLLESSNLKNKVNILDMAPTEMPFALLSGRLDAYIVAEPFGQLAVSKKRAKNLIFSKDIEKSHICCILNFHEDILNLNGFDKVLENFKKAAHFISKNHDEAGLLGENLLGQNHKIIKNILDQNIASYDDLSIKKEDLERLKEFLIKNNLASKALLNLNIDSYLAV